MEFFPSHKDIFGAVKKSWGLAFALLLLWLISGTLEHAFFEWMNYLLKRESGFIIHNIILVINLIGSNLILSFLILAGFYCFFVVIIAIVRSLDLKIWEKKYMWPIICACVGFLVMVYGVVLFMIQKSNSLQSLTNQTYDEFIKKQDRLNKSYDDFIKKQNNLNQTYDKSTKEQDKINKSYDDYIKKQLYLIVLKNDLAKVENLFKTIEKSYEYQFSLYLMEPEERDLEQSYQTRDNSFDEIRKIAKNILNIDVIFDVIDTKTYDPDKRRFLHEESKIKEDKEGIIKDGPVHKRFRKDKCLYLSNKDIINNIIRQLNGKIATNEEIIAKQGKEIFGLPK